MELRKLFSQVGEVKNVQIAQYGLDNMIAFVEMVSEHDASRALIRLDKTVLNGNSLSVKRNPPFLFSLGRFF